MTLKLTFGQPMSRPRRLVAPVLVLLCLMTSCTLSVVRMVSLV
ncbi:unnamed protein product [Protopolystoma xenopodis]|uniref:Uncharacterized protein n=1 Tax=Protopolystoma xenopodis TaxID=117903 RepID=A0A448XRP2_9PLAT|nr:unnamed protein product [Protopolystoma xenopodis]